MPLSSDLHWPRRLFHISSGLLIAGFGSFIASREIWFKALGCLTLLILVGETLRFLIPSYNRWVTHLFRCLIRQGEEKHLSGIFYYVLGAWLSVLLFPHPIAVLAILYLALGDPVAALVGVVFGKTPALPNPDFASKSLEGSFACFVLCSVVTFLMTFALTLPQLTSFSDRFVFSLLGGLAAMIGEVLPLRTDDNLALPLLSGALLWLSASMLNLMSGLYL